MISLDACYENRLTFEDEESSLFERSLKGRDDERELNSQGDGGAYKPAMTQKQRERWVCSAKALPEDERNMLLQLLALREGEPAEFVSKVMEGNVQLLSGDEKMGLKHILLRRVEAGLTPLEAKFVAVLACLAVCRGQITTRRSNKRNIEYMGVRTVVAKDSPDHMPIITGYVIDEKERDADIRSAAHRPRASYALRGLVRDLPMGAAFEDVVAWFARFVKQNSDWEKKIFEAILEMKAIQEGKEG